MLSPASAQTKPPLSPQANQAAIRGPSDASLVGALHEFAYERGALYAIQASPQRITDIALEPGETLLSVSAGDTTRWIVGDARSGNGGATLRPTFWSSPTLPTLRPTWSS
jgi:type IV secretory pathway VirB9-like protein